MNGSKPELHAHLKTKREYSARSGNTFTSRRVGGKKAFSYATITSKLTKKAVSTCKKTEENIKTFSVEKLREILFSKKVDKDADTNRYDERGKVKAKVQTFDRTAPPFKKIVVARPSGFGQVQVFT